MRQLAASRQERLTSRLTAHHVGGETYYYGDGKAESAVYHTYESKKPNACATAEAPSAAAEAQSAAPETAGGLNAHTQLTTTVDRGVV